LSTGSAAWRAQATRNIVETNFGALSLFAVGVLPRTFIDRSDHPPPRALCILNFCPVDRGHQVKKAGGFAGGVPLYSCWLFFDEIGK
jgi:hypothetical protein